MTKKELEVRCCCTPKKLLGHLAIDEELITLHNSFSIPLPDKILELDAGDDPSDVTVETVQLSIDRFFPNVFGYNIGAPNSNPYFAIKAEGTPIEKLRRIPGFKENKSSVWIKEISIEELKEMYPVKELKLQIKKVKGPDGKDQDLISINDSAPRAFVGHEKDLVEIISIEREQKKNLIAAVTDNEQKRTLSAVKQAAQELLNKK